jgi:type IV pilus assembly protein PilV
MSMITQLVPPGASSNPARGFTLVEVLVALVVLSIGMLGMARLVLMTSHSNDSAYLRSQATALAYEMLDNMRANMSAATLTTGGYNVAMGANPTAPASCVGTACASAQDQASWDVYSWLQHLNATNDLGGGLPGGQGSITVAGNPATATIIVQWDDSAAQCVFAASLNAAACSGGSATPMSITLETSLQ